MNRILEKELDSGEQNPVSPIPRECVHDPFDFSDLLLALDNLKSLEIEKNQNQEPVFQYEEIDEEEEILDMTTIIEETEITLSQPLSEEDSTDVVAEIMDAPSVSLRIKHFKTIIIEKKPVIREPKIPLLKFPQLTMCYSFDYSKYIPGKIVTCSVLSAQNKVPISEKQISIKDKLIENNAKQAIPQAERSITDLVTRARVLLMKSQLTFQNRLIPASLNELSEKYLKGAKNDDSSQNKKEVKKRKREERAYDAKEKKKQKESKKKK